jgi:hypothetical protein
MPRSTPTPATRIHYDSDWVHAPASCRPPCPRSDRRHARLRESADKTLYLGGVNRLACIFTKSSLISGTSSRLEAAHIP